jgi:raffinose/stachyose/melibiose transport system substrate-binding protein
MEDVFIYNTGSLLQAIRPDQNLVDLSDQPWMDEVDDDFKSTVETDNGIYAAPGGTSFAGGVLYNKKVYAQLGLEVPTSWSEFMANSERIKEELPEVTPVLQAYGDDWTAQVFVLASYASIQMESPDWAQDYTDNKVHYSEEPAVAGFTHQQEVFDAGYLNQDFASLTNDQALKALAEGAGAQYPILTNAIGTIAQNNPDQLDDVGYFAMPADDPKYTAATVWQPAGFYIPKTTTGSKLEAAQTFIDFLVRSPEACAIANEVGIPGGPYVIDSCKLTGEVPPAVQELQAYFDDGRTAPALEFLSPIKGPALPAITVQVGSGITSAADGAVLYDEDVKKQAQQLGLEVW